MNSNTPYSNSEHDKCFSCPQAQTKKDELLENDESVIDAVADYRNFLSKCQKKCKLKKETGNK